MRAQFSLFFICVGKIFGTKANYIIAEVEFREGEDAHKEIDDEDEETSSQQVRFCRNNSIQSAFSKFRT